MKPSKASFCGCGLGSPQLGHWLSERHLESTFTESIHGWYRVSPVDGEFLSRHICCLAQCWACWHAYESPGGVLKRRFSLSRPGIQAYAFLTNLQAFGVWFTFQAARPHFFCLIRKLFKKKKKSSKESYHRQKRYSSSFHTEILICNNSSSQSIQKTSQAVLMNAKSEIMGQLR